MLERTSKLHRAHDLFLVLGVAGLVLALATVSAELHHSHLAARQIPITHSSQVSAEVPAAEQGDRLAERMRQIEGMGGLPRVQIPSSDQTTRAHVCAMPTNPDRDLRMILAMMATHQRQIAREGATSRHALLALSGHSVAPPNAARWAEHRQGDATRTDDGIAPCPDPSREDRARPSAMLRRLTGESQARRTSSVETYSVEGGHGLEAEQS